MKEVKIYTTQYCPFCIQAKHLLARLGINYTEVPVDNNWELRRQLAEENNGYSTVPMIFIGETFIGGYTELADLNRRGKLMEMVS